MEENTPSQYPSDSPNIPPQPLPYPDIQPNFQQCQPYQQPLYSYSQPPTPMPEKTPKKKKKQTASPEQRRLTKLAWIAILLAFLILVYCTVSDILRYYQLDSTTAAATTQDTPTLNIQYQERPVSDSVTEPDADGTYTVAGVAAAVSPSIVEIQAISNDVTVSSGSGIILTEDGYLITNAHVLEDCDTFYVSVDTTTESGETESTTVAATCIGMDTKTDLAVLKIAMTGLPAATIGDADSLQVGEEVVAIGNPAGLTGTVTNGIVSALHRKVKSDTAGYEMDCIQTNAAISPGNSGGALVNLYGQIVGITSSKYTSLYSGSTYEGLGFAISINAAMPIIEDLITQGYVSGRARIGITFRSLDIAEVREEFLQTYDLEEDAEVSGLWISEIAEDCDIANTELQEGDVITAVDGTEVTNYQDLLTILQDCQVGDTMTAKCTRFSESREKKTFSIKFTLEEESNSN